MKALSDIVRPSNQCVEDCATAIARARYNRIAPIYDWMPMQWLVAQRSRSWREKMWQMVGNSKVLEIGVVTGINIELWPLDAEITAIDLSPRMLQQAPKTGKPAWPPG